MDVTCLQCGNYNRQLICAPSLNSLSQQQRSLSTPWPTKRQCVRQSTYYIYMYVGMGTLGPSTGERKENSPSGTKRRARLNKKATDVRCHRHLCLFPHTHTHKRRSNNLRVESPRGWGCTCPTPPLEYRLRLPPRLDKMQAEHYINVLSHFE
jgi:hypothetical protein